MTSPIDKKGNQISIMYLMSLISNFNASYPAKSASDLQAHIDKIKYALQGDKFTEFAGKWKVVWGPVLCNSTKKHGLIKRRYYTDNAMYMAQSLDDSGQYFIGISGTNGISQVGWFDEDFNVKDTESWPPEFLGLPQRTDQGSISRGAKVGLEKLWKMKDPASGTIIDYIKTNLNGKNCTISIGGHSLGGCLSPVISAAIADVLMKDGQPSTQSYQGVSIASYPTAGPTPGNSGFARHLLSQCEYKAIYNAHDLVPQAWDFDDKQMTSLLNTYATCKLGSKKLDPNQTVIKNFLAWAKALPGQHNYVRLPEDTQPAEKVITWENTGLSDDTKEMKKAITGLAALLRLYKIQRHLFKLNNHFLEKGYLENFARFLVEMGIQHVGVYGTNESKKAIDLYIPEQVKKELKSFWFDIKKIDKATKKWLGYQMISVLSLLTKMAADSYKPGHEALPLTEGTDPNESFIAKTEDDENLELESLLLEFEKEDTNLLWFQNPYTL